MSRNQKLMNTPIKKWPLTEYTRFRARYHFDKPRDPTAHEYFHLSVHQMIYEQCYVGKKHPVAPMHTISISHMDEHAEYFAEAKAVCERLGIIDLMKLKHEFCEDVICQFLSTVHFGTDDARTLTWMTEGKLLTGTWAQFAECVGYPILDANAEGYFRVHLSEIGRAHV